MAWTEKRPAGWSADNRTQVRWADSEDIAEVAGKVDLGDNPGETGEPAAGPALAAEAGPAATVALVATRAAQVGIGDWTKP